MLNTHYGEHVFIRLASQFSQRPPGQLTLFSLPVQNSLPFTEGLG